MANAKRNETPLEINGKTLTLKMTFQAIAAIESDTGVDWFQLIDKLQDGNFPVRVVSAILVRGLEAAGVKYEDAIEEIEKSLASDGLRPCLDGAIAAYAAVNSVTTDSAGNGEAPAAEPATNPAS